MTGAGAGERAVLCAVREGGSASTEGFGLKPSGTTGVGPGSLTGLSLTPATPGQAAAVPKKSKE